MTNLKGRDMKEVLERLAALEQLNEAMAVLGGPQAAIAKELIQCVRLIAERIEAGETATHQDLAKLTAMGWQTAPGEPSAVVFDLGNSYAFAVGAAKRPGYRTSVNVYRKGTDEHVGFVNTEGKTMAQVHELVVAGKWLQTYRLQNANVDDAARRYLGKGKGDASN